MGLTRLVVRRPVVLLTAIAALMTLGWRARQGIPAELDPRVELPVVNVITVYAGAGPEEVERFVTRPIEDAVATVSNVLRADSRSVEGISFVTVHLQLGASVNTAAADVRARLESIRHSLPLEIQPPQIAKFDFNARPVMTLSLSGGSDLLHLRRLAEDEIVPGIGQVPGVGDVAILGGLKREVQVRADPERLAAAGIALTDLLLPLRTASVSVPAGEIVQGGRESSVRVLGEFDSLEAIRAVPIPGRQGVGEAPGGRPLPQLKLGDVAVVVDGTADVTQITRVGRRPSIGLVVSRLSDANTVQVAEGIRARLEQLRSVLPDGARLTVLQDHSRQVADALEDINATLLLGALLAVLAVFLFLHSFRDTLIVACAIPMSIVVTFLVMRFAGFTLNQMTMLALSLSVGILVDDSILVLECIHRHRAMGKSPEQAALDGRAEIGLADAANTFVDIVVFLPIAFMGGIVGQFFREFGLTIATATLASLYVSFTVTPVLAARWYRRAAGSERPGRFAAGFDRGYARLEEGYRSALIWALKSRPVVMVLGFGSLGLVGWLAWRTLGFDFTPSVDRGQVSVQIELPPGSSLAATDRVVRQVEARAIEVPEVDPGRMLATVGEIVGGFGSLPDRGPHLAQVTLQLIEKQGFFDRLLRPRGRKGRRIVSDEEVAAALRARLERISGAGRISVAAVRGLTAALSPIQIGLYGSDLKILEHVAAEVEHELRQLPMLRNVNSTTRRGRPELQFHLDRFRAGELAVSPAELSRALRTAVTGNTEAHFREADESHPIRLRLMSAGAGGLASGPSALEDLVITHRGTLPVTVADVAEARRGDGPTKILRSQRTRRTILSADVLEGVSLGDAQAAVDRVLAGRDLQGIAFRWEGDVDDMNESAGYMAAALGLAVVLAYLLMAAVFNSLLHPLAIMTSVPMALVGGLLGLILTGTTMNIVSMIGIVMLVGLVSKNAILLVDFTNTLRERGMSRTEAILASGPVRLRPILMTTLSTVIAMLPVALQIGRASEMRSPMAIVVIGGLILSTLLTLLVVPVSYTLFDDVAARFAPRDTAPAADSGNNLR